MSIQMSSPRANPDTRRATHASFTKSKTPSSVTTARRSTSPIANSTTRAVQIPLSLLAVAVASTVLFWWVGKIEVRLGPASFVSGVVLVSVLFALCALPVLRRLPRTLSPPGVWVVRFHSYAGAFALAAYFAHAGFHIPDGVLEATLATLFVAFTISGISLSVANRAFPRRIAVYGHPLRREDLRAQRTGMLASLKILIDGPKDAPENADSASVREVLGGYVTQRIYPHLGVEPSWWQVMMPRKRLHSQWLQEVASRRRYLDGTSSTTCDRVLALLRRDDALHAVETWQLRHRMLHRIHQTGIVVFWIAIMSHVAIVVQMNGWPIGGATTP